MSDRTRWTDDRLDDHMHALMALPQSVATMAVKVDQYASDSESATEAFEKLRDDLSQRDQRLHGRIDALKDALNDRDREYRRNIVLALGPIALAALLIAAKVVFGVDLPGSA